MQKSSKPLREALNLRIDDDLATEIDRIAKLQDKSASEVARQLLGYGAEVHRRLEAQRLMQHHGREFADNVAGRIEIKAEFVPFTWQEVARIQEEFETGRPQGHPKWDDLVP